MTKILVIVTNSAKLGDAEDNGTYAPELTHALREFNDAGFSYDLASIQGGDAPVYGTDIDDPVNKTMLADGGLLSAMANTKRLADVNADDYQGVFYPGGFGLLNDLAHDKAAAAITAARYDSGAVVGAVCHGPAGLLEVTLANGNNIMSGKTVTCFTRREEEEFGTIDQIPFVLQDAISGKAGQFHEVEPWGENVLVQERLVTGQNPASAGGVGQAMVKLLKS
ncbi:type 1 glutamine amidotransferase domain-containing protein [Microbulbifer agarilyticus]|uniref:type 1 glutamine amidotransferase domain-containing protein n=1 Tax=Microbulbifer agarilyticus TaxID=260552 RepID=UPI001C950379|nr:type 1 glutamine amidotransferase domain-containing protein [Microbulbifer agarilyticus]MBY6210180.1 type 1 glutamine amidotransferase domain-containing protein [Microbulbifer agarilyticus]